MTIKPFKDVQAGELFLWHGKQNEVYMKIIELSDLYSNCVNLLSGSRGHCSDIDECHIPNYILEIK